MSAKPIYIAGPITGIPDYRERFARAVEIVADNYPPCRIIHPAALPDGWTQSEYLDCCLALLRGCGMIVMLPGWQQSKGARLERAFAEAHGIQVLDLEEARL